MSFKTKHPLQNRKLKYQKVSRQYPNLIPIIVQKAPKCTLSQLPRASMLVEKKLTILQLTMMISKKLCLTGKESLYLSVQDGKGVRNLGQEETIQKINEMSKDGEDGMLYIMYSSSESFG